MSTPLNHVKSVETYQITHHYTPTDKRTIEMSEKSSAIIKKYHEVIYLLMKSKSWNINNKQKNGRLKIFMSNYGFSLSSYMLADGNLRSVTVELALNPDSLEPASVSVTLDGCERCKGAITFYIDVAVLMDNTVEYVANKISSIMVGMTDHLMMKASDFKMINLSTTRLSANAIMQNQLDIDFDAVKRARIIGYDANCGDSKVIISYSLNDKHKLIAKVSLEDAINRFIG